LFYFDGADFAFRSVVRSQCRVHRLTV
jgi:hypothetical protein